MYACVLLSAFAITLCLVVVASQIHAVAKNIPKIQLTDAFWEILNLVMFFLSDAEKHDKILALLKSQVSVSQLPFMLVWFTEEIASDQCFLTFFGFIHPWHRLLHFH